MTSSLQELVSTVPTYGDDLATMAVHFGIDVNKTEKSCQSFGDVYPDPSMSPYFYGPFIVAYLFLFVFGLCGNLLLMYVTLKHKTLQSVQNIFIMNLAASDLLMCLLSVPITPVANVMKNWMFGGVLCHLIPCIQGVSIFVCTFSLGAIAVDRYKLVVCPHSKPLSKKGAAIVIVVMWTVSVIVTLPYAFYMQHIDYESEGICGMFCTESWPNPSSRRFYTMLVMLAQFCFPFICMAYCYCKIFGVLNERAKTKLRKMDERSFALEQTCVIRSTSTDTLDRKVRENGDNTINSFIEKQEKERAKLLQQTRRTTIILLFMVLWFIFSWMPHNALSLIIEYDEGLTIFKWFHNSETEINYLLNMFTHCLSMTNVVVNPFIYAWLNPQVRSMVISTCLGKDKQRNPSQRTVYVRMSSQTERKRNISKKTNGSCTNGTTKTVSSDSKISSPVKEVSKSPSKTFKDCSDIEKKALKIEFSENDTYV